MRLLNVETLQLESVSSEFEVPYAILSHCWGEEEVLYQDMINGTAHQRKGYFKIVRFCDIARREGLRYVWIDTCCIDKSSSAELSEAINSMFRWYKHADTCFAYMHDCPDMSYSRHESRGEEAFYASKWFTRGWTLQELIAAVDVVFLSADWEEFGTRRLLRQAIQSITNIHLEVLLDSSKVDRYSVAQRFSWAAGRVTTRPEDRAYSLMGLFGVNMPMLYGEGGENAFLRLQLEILRQIDDQTILAWDMNVEALAVTGVLAPSPDCFQHRSGIQQKKSWAKDRILKTSDSSIDRFSHQLVGQFIKLNAPSLELQMPDDGDMHKPGRTETPQVQDLLSYIDEQLRKYAHELRAGVYVALLEDCVTRKGRAVYIVLRHELSKFSRVHLPTPPRDTPILDFTFPGITRRSFYALTHYEGLRSRPTPVIRLRTQPATHYLWRSSPGLCDPEGHCSELPHWCAKTEKALLTGVGNGFNPVLELVGQDDSRTALMSKFSLCFHPVPKLSTRSTLPPPFHLIFFFSQNKLQTAFRAGQNAELDAIKCEVPDSTRAVNLIPHIYNLNKDLAVVVKVRQGAGDNYQLHITVEDMENAYR